MNVALLTDPLLNELRQLVAELSMISHISGTSYDGKIARETTDDIGGGRPPGGDQEYRPRAPRSPLVKGDARSEKEWDEYNDELGAWRACYQRRNPKYFADQLERCESSFRLGLLLEEARETLEAWKRTPLPRGQDPEFGSAQWKRWVAESREDPGVLATRFSVTRRYINKIRQQYRAAA